VIGADIVVFMFMVSASAEPSLNARLSQPALCSIGFCEAFVDQEVPL
jgi:hypothetical protein